MDFSPSAASTASQCTLQDVSTSQLVAELKRRHANMVKPEKRVIFLGPPGCGKGTQSAIIKEHFNLAHLSSGDMLRESVAAKTPLGLKAEAIMKAGELVPDEIVLGLIEDKLKSPAVSATRGFILDGFPRTVAQAESLENMLKSLDQSLDAVIYFEVNSSLLVRRVCGRRVHQPSGRVYHVDFNPPKVPNRDDYTGELLIHRKDDNEDTLRKRLSVYADETAPLVAFYEKRGLLHRIDGTASPEAVTDTLMTMMGDFSFAFEKF